MPEVKTTTKPTTFLTQLLSNRPSGSVQSAENTAQARIITRVYPQGTQSTNSNKEGE